MVRHEEQLVKGAECQICGMDIQELPNVKGRNQEIKGTIQQLGLDLAKKVERLEEMSASLTKIQIYKDKITHQQALAKPYIGKWFTFSPLVWLDKPPGQADTTDYDHLITTQLALHKKNQDIQQQQQSAKSALEHTLSELKGNQVRLENLQPDFQDARLRLAKAKELKAMYAGSNAEAALCQRQTAVLEQELSTLQIRYNLELNTWKLSQDRLASATQMLTAMQLHNTVIKKIREARPEVAKRLWGSVLSAVSHFFGSIRGTPSTVSRGESGFVVDGHPALALSGSALDSLGLAIRLGLTKTFLPNMRFMLLDEASAACDDQREQSMIATVVASDMDQVILVTHSQELDSFAQEIIQL